jgi:hypothetical protein
MRLDHGVHGLAPPPSACVVAPYGAWRWQGMAMPVRWEAVSVAKSGTGARQAVKRRADTTYLHSELMGRRYGLVVGDILTTATDAGLISSVSVQALS